MAGSYHADVLFRTQSADKQGQHHKAAMRTGLFHLSKRYVACAGVAFVVTLVVLQLLKSSFRPWPTQPTQLIHPAHDQDDTSDPSRPQLYFREDGTFTIIQFTDLHFGRVGATNLATQKMMEAVLESVDADLVVMSGDMVSSLAPTCARFVSPSPLAGHEIITYAKCRTATPGSCFHSSPHSPTGR